MLQLARWVLFPLVIVGLPGGFAAGATPEIKDLARPPFFKSETVQTANQIVHQIHDQYGKELIVETFSSVPQADRDKVTKMSREDREKYFSEWLEKLVREQQVNGIFVLVCRSPGHVEVGVDRGTEKKDFLPDNRRELRTIFFDRLSKSNYKPDEALTRGVEYVRDALKAHHVGGKSVGQRGAATPEVKDLARPPFFKTETVQTANQVVRQIHDQYGKELIVETFSSVPQADRDQVTKMSREDREKYFSEWLEKLVKEQQVNGIFVLVCRSPGHVEVGVDRGTEKKDFLPDNRRELRTIFFDRLSKNNYKPDEALTRGVEYVRDTLKSHGAGGALAASGKPAQVISPVVSDKVNAAPTPANVPSATNLPGGLPMGIGGMLCIGLIALLVIWVIIGVVRSIMKPRGYYGSGPGPGGRPMAGGGPGYGAGQGYGGGPGYGGYGGGPGYGGGGGGGGFLSGLVGGMFGAAAGSWAYDRFFREHGSTGAGASPAYGAGASGAASQAPASEERRDFDTSGADAGGDDLGGGGVAGGDAGGNDFGGGEPAGGGDQGSEDFGGGGGDFDSGGGDAGGGGDDFGGGGDTGGGGDFGGGGGDFGGGGGGDFGGGGGDFGGGGGGDS